MASGFNVASGKGTIGATATLLSDIVGIKRANAVLLTPETGDLIYLGAAGVSATTGLLLPSIGKDLPRLMNYDQYKLDEIYVVGASSGDIVYVCAIYGG